jgi:amino acid transporter
VIRDNLSKSFSFIKASSVLIGIVIGTGIFSFPPLIAANTSNPVEYIFMWLMGGFISLMGAFCYAELASAYPDTGGEYTYLKTNYGRAVGFIFIWSRMIIIQTGSIAIISLVIGDYITSILPLGSNSSSVYAFGTVLIFSILNITGTKYAQVTQVVFTILIISLIIIFSIKGFFANQDVKTIYTFRNFSMIGFKDSVVGPALILVLLTFGGWNETSYLAGEMKNTQKNMIRTLVFGIMVITILYIVINIAFIRILGFEGVQKSTAVAYDIAHSLWGPYGSFVVVILVLLCAFSTLNASILTGARTNYILGKEYSLFKFMGKWDRGKDSPVPALIMQGTVSLVFVTMGFFSVEKIKNIVDFTTPVFWFFLILISGSVFVTRFRQPEKKEIFKMPLYPIPVIIFLCSSIYLFYSSLKFTGIFALYGIALCLTGVPVWYLNAYKEKKDKKLQST